MRSSQGDQSRLRTQSQSRGVRQRDIAYGVDYGWITSFVKAVKYQIRWIRLSWKVAERWISNNCFLSALSEMQQLSNPYKQGRQGSSLQASLFEILIELVPVSVNERFLLWRTLQVLSILYPKTLLTQSRLSFRANALCDHRPPRLRYTTPALTVCLGHKKSCSCPSCKVSLGQGLSWTSLSKRNFSSLICI